MPHRLSDFWRAADAIESPHHGSPLLWRRRRPLLLPPAPAMSVYLRGVASLHGHTWPLYAAGVPNATVLLSTVTEINATKCLSYGAGPCPPDMPANIAALTRALPTAVVAPFVAKGKR